MGIGIGGRCRSNPYAILGSGNPDPEKFFVQTADVIGSGASAMLLLAVKYRGVSNFEGRKILVYKGFDSLAGLLKASNNKLDPHFANSVIAPIARFQPTLEGWQMATKFCEMWAAS